MTDTLATLVDADTTSLEAGRRDSVLTAYPYECSCGEQYRQVTYAVSCRKCRVYSMGGRCLYVHDTRTGELVYGRLPTAEEEVEYVEEMEREAEETRDYIAMCEESGERYERIMAEQVAEAARLARVQAIDAMYAIQDELMGY